MLVGLRIGDVVEALENGAKVTRQGWNGRGMHLYYVPANEETRRRAFVMVYTAEGEHVPWTCSQSDLLAKDWMIANA